MPKCGGAKLPYFGVNIRFHGTFPWLKVAHQLFSTVKGAKNKKTDWNNNNSSFFMRFLTRHGDIKKITEKTMIFLGLFCQVLNSSFHLQKE